MTKWLKNNSELLAFTVKIKVLIKNISLLIAPSHNKKQKVKSKKGAEAPFYVFDC